MPGLLVARTPGNERGHAEEQRLAAARHAMEGIADAVGARYAASDAGVAILGGFDTRAYAQSSQENVVGLLGKRF